MPGLVPGIHVLAVASKEDVEGRDMGVLEKRRSSNSYAGHDEDAATPAIPFFCFFLAV
jgi:hypothetical protein